MDMKTLFTGRVESYTKGRPAYASELIDFLFNEIGIKNACTVADIGAGTGIFSKQLLQKGCKVFCVEPNEDMRNALKQNVGDFQNAVIVDGDAENTKLKHSSVDIITVAQAFHWFDTDKFLTESKRILKPDGIVALIWNNRNECDFNAENYSVFQRYCPRFKGFSGGMQNDNENVFKFFNGKFEYAEFDNSLTYTKQQFVDRCLSASYSLLPNDPEFNAYLHELEASFDKYAENGILKVANKSVMYWGKV